MKKLIYLIAMFIAVSCYSQTIINAPDVAIKSDSILFVDAQRSAKHLPLSTMIDWVKGELSTENEVIKGSWLHQQNYDFHVEASEYIIQNTYYDFFIESDITLSIGDAAFDRIDIVVVNHTQTFSVIEGEPSIIPHEPDVADNQAVLFFVLVKANTTAPGIVTNILVYDENTGEPSEWDNSTSTATTVDTNYLLDFSTGTKSTSIDDTNGVAYFQNRTTTYIDATNIQNINFDIKFIQIPNTAQRVVSIGTRNDNLNSYDNYELSSNDFGLDETSTLWQSVVIPAQWVTGSASTINTLFMDVTRPDIHILVDNVKIQLIDGIITTPIDPTQQTLTFNETTNVLGISDGNEVDLSSLSGGGGVTDHTLLTNIGTNTHAQIDTHIANNTGVNTGDQDLSGYLLNTTDSFTGTLTIGGDLIVNGTSTSSGFKTPTGTNLNVLLDGGGVKLVSSIGDVSKVGTTLNNQVGVWTGNGTLEGSNDFSYTDGRLYVADVNDDSYIETTGDIQSSNFIMKLGDITDANNGTKILLDDLNQTVEVVGLAISSGGFKKGSGTDLNVLLDGGGTKLLTDFALSTRFVQIALSDMTTALTTGINVAQWPVPYDCKLVGVHVQLSGAGTGTGITVDVLERTSDVTSISALSTKITTDATEWGSDTATTPAVINTLFDDFLQYDLLSFNIDGVPTGATGLIITLELALN